MLVSFVAAGSMFVVTVVVAMGAMVFLRLARIRSKA